MVLGSDKIFNLIKNEKLIENLPEEGFIIEGCTVDFRLDTVFKNNGGAILMEKSRNTGDVIELHPDEHGVYELQPLIPYLFSTIEKVNIPDGLVMHIGTRTTMFRSGIILTATYTNPGYSGILTFMACNCTESSIPIQRGFRIAQACFQQIDGEVIPYAGAWNGGKIHTNNKEIGAR